MNHKIYIFVLLLVLLIGFLLRFYKLGEIPSGFYQDESAIGYNAYSIIKTGKDEHGQPFPLYFKSFGDYKLPVYIYLTALSIQIFGLNEFAVRFPSALFGFLTVIVFYFFVKELTKNRPLSIISTAFLAICPWHLHYNRATFEVSISLFLFVLGGLFLYKSFYNKTPFAFLFGSVCFIISFYSYNLTRFLAPALYLLFLVSNKSQVKKIPKKEQLLTVFVSSILFIPFVETFFQSGGIASAQGTLIFSSKAVQAPLLEFRSYFVEQPLIAKLFFSNLPLTIWQYLQNVVSSFAPSFFFVFGSPHGNHGIGNVGQFYLFQFPLMVLGMITIVLEKPRWSKFFILWALVIIFIVSLTREVPHATRSFFLIVPFEIFSGFGALSLISWLANIKKLRYKIGALILCTALAIYSILFYFASYYVRFPVLYAREWRMQDKAVALYIKENQDKYNKIIFDSEGGYVYSSLLFYLKYKPEEFQKSVVWYPDDSEGFSMPKSFGKFEFRAIDWSKDYVQKKTLIITTQDKKPKEIPLLYEFFYPKRPVVLSIKQDIVQYPVKETAYVVVSSK